MSISLLDVMNVLKCSAMEFFFRKGMLILVIPKSDSPEEEMKKWLNHIALICLSEEFQELKKELETIYSQSNSDEFRIMAFQDALYVFLSQEEENLAVSNGSC